MRTRVPLLILAIILLIGAPAAAAGPVDEVPACADYENYFHWEGWNSTDGQYYDIDLSDEYAYVTDRFGSIHIFDLSIPASPVRVAEMPCGEDPKNVKLHDTIGVVRVTREDEEIPGYYYNDLYLVDISEPVSPSVILILEAFGFRSSAEVAQHVYLGRDNGLVVVDVSDADSPAVTEVDPLQENTTILGVADSFLLVRTPTRICSLDLFDPGSPVLSSEVAVSDVRDSYQIVGDRLLVMTTDSLMEIDISNPDNIHVMGETPLDQDASLGKPRQLMADEETAFLIRYRINGDPLDEMDNIQIIDISTPGIPTMLGFCDVPRQTMVEYKPPFLYSSAQAGICVIDASDLTSPSVALWTKFVLGSRAFACNASHMYTTCDGGLSTFSFAEGALVSPIGHIETPGLARGLDVEDGLAFVADWRDGVQVIDIETSDPWKILSSLPIDGPTTSLIADGEFLYVGDRTNGLVVVDKVNPASMEIVETIAMARGADCLGIRGDLMAVGSGSELILIDISDPRAPIVLGSWEAPSVVSGIVLAPGIAYLASGRDFLVADIGDPGSISAISSLELPNTGESLTVEGGFAYVGIFRAGVVVIDVSDPFQPWIAGRQITPDACYGVTFYRDHIYASAGQSGVQIIDVSLPGQPSLIGRAGYIEPNPDHSHLLLRTMDAEVVRERLYFVDEFGLQAVPLQCGEETEAIEVALDLKPGNTTDPVNCNARGILQVAVLTTQDFDALEVDHETVVFGPGEAPEAHSNRHGAKRRERDVDHDGDLDLLLHFRIQEADLDCSLGEAALTGTTYDGRGIHGVVTFRPVPNPHGGPREKMGLLAKPNPFNPRTTIMFNLDGQQAVSLRIYDVAGRLIKTLYDAEVLLAGRHEVAWNGRDDAGRQVASGAYFYCFGAGSYFETKRMVLVK